MLRKGLVALLIISILLLPALTVNHIPVAHALLTNVYYPTAGTNPAYEYAREGSSSIQSQVPQPFTDPTSLPQTYWKEIDNYANVHDADGFYEDTGIWDNNKYALVQQNYRFTINELASDIDHIVIEWVGYIYDVHTSWYPNGIDQPSALQIKTDTGYENITDLLPFWKGERSKAIMSNFDNYRDNNNILYLRAWMYDADNDGAWLYTDMVRVTVFLKAAATETVTQTDTVTQGSETLTQTVTETNTVTQASGTVTQTNTETVIQTNTVTQGSETVTQTETVGGGQIQVVGQAYVVIGAPLGSLRVTKPAGTSSAAWIDATAASIILGMIQSPSFTYDVNGTAINQGQDPNSGGGQPQVPAPTMIIMSGGPLVNGPVAYYENDARNGKLENAPVYFYQWQDPDGHTYREFRKSIDNSEILTSKADLSILGNHLDYFLIESFHDANGNQVVMIYGYTGYGTFAGALYFKTKLFPAMGNTLSDGYQIVQWYDSNANGFVDTADSFTVVGIQNWPVPP
jgi:hypothetical protein